MRPRVMLIALLALGTPPAMAKEEAIVLRFDPFERPDRDRVEYRGSTAAVVTRIATSVMKLNAKHLTGYKGSKQYMLGVVRGDQAIEDL